MRNTQLRFFVDTTVAVSALTGRNDEAWALLETGRRGMILLFVNEFIIKEIRWTLKEFHISQEKINYGIDYVKECCTVRKNVHELAFLVTEDSVLWEDAKKYIECGTPGEALKKLS